MSGVPFKPKTRHRFVAWLIPLSMDHEGVGGGVPIRREPPPSSHAAALSTWVQAANFVPVEGEHPRSFSRHTSPRPSRRTPVFGASGGQPTAADAGRLGRDSPPRRGRPRSVADGLARGGRTHGQSAGGAMERPSRVHVSIGIESGSISAVRVGGAAVRVAECACISRLSGGAPRLARRDEGAARRAVTEEATPSSRDASGFPGEAFAWQGATREQPGGL